MRRFLGVLVAVAMVIFGGALVGGRVFATNSCAGVDTSILSCKDNDNGVDHILQLVVDILSIGVGVLGVLGITIVGIQYLTAGGSEEKTRKAKQRMLEIIIGLIAYVLIYALLKWLKVG